MRSQRRHLKAVAALLEESLAAVPAGSLRHLLDLELANVEQHILATGSVGARTGGGAVLRLIESCRDQHLADLDADDGLAALGVTTEDIVLLVQRRRRESDRARMAHPCSRCGAQMRIRLRRPGKRTRRRKMRSPAAAAEPIYRCLNCDR